MLFLLLFACYLYFFQIFPSFVSPNELSRLLLTSAVVEERSFRIDHAIQRYGDTIDKAIFRGNTYSDKAFGTSLLSIPPFLLLQWIERTFHVQFSASVAIWFLRIFIVTIPSLLFAGVISRFWQRMRPGDKLIPYFALLLLFGTIGYTYSHQLISHYLLGILLFVPVYLLSGYHDNPEEIPRKNLWLTGLAIGLAMTMEYPAAPAVLILCFYVLWIVRRPKRLAPIVLVASIFLLMMLAYNYAIFGTPFDVTYRHMVGALTEHHAQGIVGVGLPKREAIWGLLFSRDHGLFYMSPFLLFSLPGLVQLIKHKYWKAEGWLSVAISLSILLIYCGFANWIGGWAVGPRYLAPLIPFLTTAAFYFFTQPQIRSNSFFRVAGLSTAALSVIFVMAGTITFPYPPALFDDPFSFVFFPMILKGAQSISVGEMLGLLPLGALLLFATLVMIALLVAVAPGGKLRLSFRVASEIVASGIAVAAFLTMTSVTLLERGPDQYYGRGLIYGFCGKYKEATADMATALRKTDHRALEQRIRTAMGQFDEILRANAPNDTRQN